jgi:endonuclease/exonuclease/phosphatase family metal-dependent hydrolase
MKNYLSIPLLIIGLFISNIIVIPTKAITIGTYNIEHGDISGFFTQKALFAKEGNWSKRKQGVSNIIKNNMKADIYGFQEVITDNNQFDDIKEALPGYGHVGQPRSTYTGEKLWQYVTMLAATDEHNPIFYNQDTIKLLDNGTFGTNANTATHLKLLPRICTWAHFKEKTTDKDFFAYNTHLDNGDSDNRIAQMKTILNDIKQRCDTKPVLLMGDLNTTCTGDMQETLSEAGFIHGKTVAKQAKQDITTHLKKGKPFEVDHILVKPTKAFNIKTYKLCGERNESTSDHNPICMNFSLN